MRSRRLTVAVSMLVAAAGTMALAQQAVTVRPVFSAADRLSDWDVDGSGQWAIANGMLVLTKAGVPGGPIRRPAAIAVLKGVPFARVSVQTQMRSTAPLDVVNRDLEIIFGYQSPTRFYYVHLAGITNDVHNGVFLVNGADRKRIDAGTAPPQLKDQQWHRVRLERDGASGRIQIYVDGSATPAWDLTDTTIAAGRIGLGSFDDTGEFRDVVVTGTPSGGAGPR